MREKLTEEFDISHVTESVFATVNQLHENISLLSKDLETSGRQGKKTLLVVCYRGGGGLDMRCLETYAIMQGGKAFPIEHLLRDLAKIQNCYVLGVLDCPRLRLETQIFDGYNFKDEEAKNLMSDRQCPPDPVLPQQQHRSPPNRHPDATLCLEER